jgi:type 1 glutamine amidotransferase
VLRAIKWIVGLVLGGALLLLALFIVNFGPANFGRMAFGIGRGYDQTPPALPDMSQGPAVLIFSKTNGYRDDPQIAAANKALVEIARSRGWASFVTENGAVFNPAQLRRFNAVVWNSVSGDVLTPAQRRAFRTWLEAGGGFVGLHGAGGDPEYAWKWYVDSLIGAQFIGHTMGPQFQRATLIIEDRTHPATRHLGPTWVRTDEWYSFASNPREKGYRILARIDERSYQPKMKPLPFSQGREIAMGADHPMVWLHCVGDGRAFYSALGHPASAYAEPAHRAMIAGAIAWAAGLEGSRCEKGREVAARR